MERVMRAGARDGDGRRDVIVDCGDCGWAAVYLDAGTARTAAAAHVCGVPLPSAALPMGQRRAMLAALLAMPVDGVAQ